MQRMRFIHEQKALPGPEGPPLAFLPDQQKDRPPAAAGLNNNPMPAGMGLFVRFAPLAARTRPPALPGTGRVRIGVTFFLSCKEKG